MPQRYRNILTGIRRWQVFDLRLFLHHHLHHVVQWRSPRGSGRPGPQTKRGILGWLGTEDQQLAD